VLKYYADLSEAQIAASMGISRGAGQKPHRPVARSGTAGGAGDGDREKAQGGRERPGARGMTAQERDYEAILSRVLHTTTDQLEPVGDVL